MSISRGNLESFWDKNRVSQAILIKTNDVEKAFNNLKIFIHKILSKFTDISIENNTDIVIIDQENLETKTKIISVDEIRKLQKNLNFSQGFSPFKFGIIKNAELMNANASNSCLKILEEPPENTYIFLITKFPELLLTTIKSRCFLIYDDDQDITNNSTSKDNFTILFEPNKKIEDYLKLIDEISKLYDDNRDITEELKENFVELVKHAILIKNQIEFNNKNFNEYFIKIAKIYSNHYKKEIDLINFSKKIEKNFDNIKKHNLDLKQILLLIISEIEIFFNH